MFRKLRQKYAAFREVYEMDKRWELSMVVCRLNNVSGWPVACKTTRYKSLTEIYGLWPLLEYSVFFLSTSRVNEIYANYKSLCEEYAKQNADYVDDDTDDTDDINDAERTGDG